MSEHEKKRILAWIESQKEQSLYYGSHKPKEFMDMVGYILGGEITNEGLSVHEHSRPIEPFVEMYNKILANPELKEYLLLAFILSTSTGSGLKWHLRRHRKL